MLWRPQARQWSFCLPAFVLPLRVILSLPQRVQAMVSVIMPLVYSKQFAFNHYPKSYNPFDHLLKEADMREYLTHAFMDDDPAFFVTALGHVARHRGIAQLANDTGLNRESLYKALSGKSQPK